MKPQLLALGSAVSCMSAFAQVINIRDGQTSQPTSTIQVATVLPKAIQEPSATGTVSLQGGLFRERRELNTRYLLKLRTENLLQNHTLEAGVRTDRPLEDMHQGWESPACQLRGHFLGHWMSAAAYTATLDHNPELASRLTSVVAELDKCQTYNGGKWVGSIPEKYFDILNDAKRWVWSPQYTLHKTLLGLQDTYRLTGNKEALQVLERGADWFSEWTAAELKTNHPEAIYGGESCGMLELWANLYGTTHKASYLELASRYAQPDQFAKLLAGADPLSNAHTNASIPWFQGAARMYEVTGDPRFRKIVERFWECAVTQRGMFATTGNNAGEYWVPSQQFNRFLGSRTQEHCTVYNMIRIAQYLLKWTGDARYADYIETALYNGVLAQQNAQTGMPCYFLPLEPGSKKVWGSETHDFWCCHGTIVQAHASVEDLIYASTGQGLVVNQFIPSTINFEINGSKVALSQKFDEGTMASDFQAKDGTSHWVIAFEVKADQEGRWPLRLRQPVWISGKAKVLVDEVEVPCTTTPEGYLQLERTWKSNRVKLVLPKRLMAKPLPGDAEKVALMDGPVVLGGLTDKETSLLMPSASAPIPATPMYEHQYSPLGEWQSSHYLVRGRNESITFKPLYEITDERYTVYFNVGTAK